MYTIGQVSKMFGIPISTLRYYDKEGLFPDIKRESGIRQFSDNEIAQLRIIECLKKSGLEIKDIQQFMSLSREGKESYGKRLALLTKQKEMVIQEMGKMQEVLDMLTFKCWYYETAIEMGEEKMLWSLKPNEIPEEIRKAYENSHKALK